MSSRLPPWEKNPRSKYPFPTYVCLSDVFLSPLSFLIPLHLSLHVRHLRRFPGHGFARSFPELSVLRFLVCLSTGFAFLYVFLRNGRFCESGTSYCLRVFSPPPPPSPQVFVRVSPRIPLHVLSHTFGCLPHPRLVYGTSKTWSLSAFLQSDALPMKLRILLFLLDQSVFVVK